MSTPALRYDSDEKEMYQFACPNCWAVRTVTLTRGTKRPMCDCGAPLSVIGEVESEEAESLSLDHPHTEPNCSFSAAAFAAAGLSSVTTAQAQPGPVPGTKNHYYVPATDKTVHWGYFSKLLKPQVEVASGDFVTIEALTHHANDDADRMVKGDAGAESVFYWDKQRKGVDRRGAGPMNPALFGRGADEGLGV